MKILYTAALKLIIFVQIVQLVLPASAFPAEDQKGSGKTDAPIISKESLDQKFPVELTLDRSNYDNLDNLAARINDEIKDLGDSKYCNVTDYEFPKGNYIKASGGVGIILLGCGLGLAGAITGGLVLLFVAAGGVVAGDGTYDIYEEDNFTVNLGIFDESGLPLKKIIIENIKGRNGYKELDDKFWSKCFETGKP
jgi:hypothetical protein